MVALPLVPAHLYSISVPHIRWPIPSISQHPNGLHTPAVPDTLDTNSSGAVRLPLYGPAIPLGFHPLSAALYHADNRFVPAHPVHSLSPAALRLSRLMIHRLALGDPDNISLDSLHTPSLVTFVLPFSTADDAAISISLHTVRILQILHGNYGLHCTLPFLRCT